MEFNKLERIANEISILFYKIRTKIPNEIGEIYNQLCQLDTESKKLVDEFDKEEVNLNAATNSELKKHKVFLTLQTLRSEITSYIQGVDKLKNLVNFTEMLDNDQKDINPKLCDECKTLRDDIFNITKTNTDMAYEIVELKTNVVQRDATIKLLHEKIRDQKSIIDQLRTEQPIMTIDRTLPFEQQVENLSLEQVPYRTTPTMFADQLRTDQPIMIIDRTLTSFEPQVGNLSFRVPEMY